MRFFVGLMLATAATLAQGQASSEQQKAVLQYLKSGAEPQVKDAVWTSDTMLKVGMFDNRSPRDGFAQYLCEELYQRGIRGVRVQIIDLAKLVRTDEWVKLGQARCR